MSDSEIDEMLDRLAEEAMEEQYDEVPNSDEVYHYQTWNREAARRIVREAIAQPVTSAPFSTR